MFYLFASPLEHDELREIFNDISSSSEDEDERDHHDDEDLNIMDTEEDLERQLQDKLNESDGQQQENEGSNQIGEWVAECSRVTEVPERCRIPALLLLWV